MLEVQVLPSVSHTGKQKGERGKDVPQQVLTSRKRNKTRKASFAMFSQLKWREKELLVKHQIISQRKKDEKSFSSKSRSICPNCIPPPWAYICVSTDHLPQSGKEKPENAPVSIRKINKKLMSSEACTIITLGSITPMTDKT